MKGTFLKAFVCISNSFIVMLRYITASPLHEVVPRVYRELASHDFSSMLRGFQGPTLIINGENDKPNRKREAALLKDTQDGQLQIIKQAGHICNLEQPEAFTQQARTFAKRLSARSG